MSLWGSGLRHKPSIGHLYGLAAKEAYHRGVANIKAPPGFKDAYYVEDAIDRYLGIENAFGKYSITAVVDSLGSSTVYGSVQVGALTEKISDTFATAASITTSDTIEWLGTRVLPGVSRGDVIILGGRAIRRSWIARQRKLKGRCPSRNWRGKQCSLYRGHSTLVTTQLGDHDYT